MINLEKREVAGRFAFLELGFRPFFLGAAVFAVLSILVWMGISAFGLNLRPGGLPAMTWHAHEMIFGYSLAVVAGFLLTAIHNWTDRPTLNGIPLLLLFLLWAGARILPFYPGAPLESIAALDILFIIVLIISTSRPVLKARQWEHSGILLIGALILFADLIYYFGAFGILKNGVSWGLTSGLYLILLLILTMGRRVFPTFIERGVGYPVRLTNRTWLDMAGTVLFVFFWIADILRPNAGSVALLAGLLFVLHTVRLAGWHTPGIWKKPLLWVLFLAYAFLVSGFALKAAVFVFHISPFLPIHAFAFGGIGLMTIGMMARVALGHTGRNVLAPPSGLFWIFSLLFIGAVVRVFFPLLDFSHYKIWIGLSQALWIISFSWWLYVYSPMLVRRDV